MTESLFSCFFLTSQLKSKIYSMTMGIFSFKLGVDIKQKQHSLCTNFGYLLTMEKELFSRLYCTELNITKNSRIAKIARKMLGLQ